MKQPIRPCDHSGHAHADAGCRPPANPVALAQAAALFRALGDPERLRLIVLLLDGEYCVTELVEDTGEKFSTVSQRLRLLRSERLVTKHRAGLHVFYRLADAHVADLVRNALAHATEQTTPSQGVRVMAHTHANHDHTHGPACGHTAVAHDGHTDYLHDGHLHHQAADGTVTEHSLTVGGANPAACTPDHACGGHEAGHVHGPDCGHEAVPHGDHTDYLVAGHLHHPHGDHCDDHGPVAVAK